MQMVSSLEFFFLYIKRLSPRQKITQGKGKEKEGVDVREMTVSGDGNNHEYEKVKKSVFR
ncbi:hypothetical protein Phum_PHUM329290 [Pediculus humanus corporis]|uniref:Uncharacterized protein n=1 Tax=Pediculus humanus subsp. corporis TaxID=121224 RepID=E0VN65_PEDHC|nr:uncharacterized protein Phum_PHUM329290 [Pediculus humanus corporis]EEB14821.1 hypothetical protein Phum_PHUM329290 [Pediculus humanus corporis]